MTGMSCSLGGGGAGGGRRDELENRVKHLEACEDKKKKTKAGHPLSYRSPEGSCLSGFLSLIEMPHFTDLRLRCDNCYF